MVPKLLFLLFIALRAAANFGHKGVVKVLLEHNVDVNAVNEYPGDRWTVLTVAVFNGYKDIAELLLQNNADVNADVKGSEVTGSNRNALIWAVKKGHIDIGKCIF